MKLVSNGVLSIALMLALLSPVVVQTAHANVITVRSDGSGDYTSVLDAVDASAAGDTIEIGPGTYSAAPIYVSHQLAFVSTDGPAATVLDATPGGEIIRFVSWTVGCSVEGLTFTGSYRTSAAVAALIIHYALDVTVEDCEFTGNASSGIALATGCSAVIRDCSFHDNNAPDGPNGGIYVSGVGTVASIESCDFRDNYTSIAGGGVSVVAGATATITDCSFVDNTALWGGGVHCGETATANVYGSLFVHNRGVGAAMYYFRSAGEIAGNTFYDNVARPDFPPTAVLPHETSSVVFRKNIVAGTQGGTALYYFDASGTHECNVYWQNDLGTMNVALDATETVADPVFCDPLNGDYTVSSQGPAAPANSACGELIGAYPVGCDIVPPPPPPPPSDDPRIVAITDVPNDQGRQVRVKWRGSDQDAPATEYTITGYAIYRYQEMLEPSSSSPLALPGKRGRGSAPAIDGWDYLLTVPARGDSVYQTIVPTLCDSTRQADCANAFFVSALTPDPLVFFDSEPDTGRSVDNLPPGPPLALAVSYQVGSGVQVAWDAPDEPDVELYRVYRGSAPGFDIDPSLVVNETDQTGWTDVDGDGSCYYRVSAVDYGGNEGPATGSSAPTGAEGRPFAYDLGQNVPNPFNPATVIPYEVGEGGGRVVLRVYDVSGRLVATLVDGFQSAGPKSIAWEGLDAAGNRVASGVYFYRLTAPGYEKTLKMTVIQ